MWLSFYRISLLLTFDFCVVSSLGTYHQECCLLRTLSGYVKGRIQYSSTGRAVETYLGIPYAIPPVGRLRFKYPVPIGSWHGVLDATKYGKSCVQMPYIWFRKIPGLERFIPRTPFSEDCLTINVFVPKPRPRKAAVMVFIHGGGFSIGGTSLIFFDGVELSGVENIIVVSMNYRLASLGFLNVDHPEVDPNCGLMDQVLALHWVRQHIRQFGGNSDDVTLFGHSAGGMSIGYHMYSPLSKGLFKRGILQSGTPFSDDFISTKADNLELAIQTGKNLNCSDLLSTDALVKCLMRTEANLLVRNEPIRKAMSFIFRPVIDGYIVPENPITASKAKRHFRNVDIMTGAVKNEGTLFLCQIKPIVFVPLFDKVGPYHEEFLEVVKFIFPKQCNDFYKSVELLYTDWQHFNTTDANLKSSEDFIADYWFNCPLRSFLDFYADMGANIYSYYFPYRSTSIDYVKWIGTPHTDELRFLMGEVTKEQKYSADEKLFSYELMRYWANFARTGNPNLSPREAGSYANLTMWPKYSKAKEEILVLMPGEKEVIKRVESKQCSFWENTYPQLKRTSKNSNSCHHS